MTGIRMLWPLAALVLLAGPAPAAGPPDPDWPCVQRRMPHLSLGQLWSGPAPDAAALAAAETPEVLALARHIALRRTTMEEAEARIAEFARGREAPALTALAQATFAQIERQRSTVMAGITRYAHRQEALDRDIKEKRDAFARLEAADPPDFDRIDALEREIDWATRIFRDRQQSLNYVCETPVILEQRAFALLRLIAARLPG